eukprot:scaffold588155_cov41-Prasinocladus_malaysianus.AAC.1
MYNFTEDECGPVHITVGDGGNYEGPSNEPWFEPQPHWSAFRQASFGVAQLEFDGTDEAVWTWNRQACVQKESPMLNVWSNIDDAAYFVPVGDANGS